MSKQSTNTKSPPPDKELDTRSIYLSGDLEAALEKLAKAEGRSFNNYVVRLLRQHVAIVNATAVSEGA